jgi:hypothetical protein
MIISFTRSLSRDKKKTFRGVLIGEEAESQALTGLAAVIMFQSIDPDGGARHEDVRNT